MIELHLGDCREILADMDENSIDSVVTDCPYELGFMGNDWDKAGVSFQPETWKQVLRVLKPGGYLLAFGGSRTYHRIAVAIEDAGFEIRDTIAWLYSSGFPKSHNVGMSMDKLNGVAPRGKAIPTASTHLPNGKYLTEKLTGNPVADYEPVTEEGKQWNGWGNNLKPAFEPIIMARKPLAKGKTIARNVREYGTGAINIKDTLIATEDEVGRNNKNGPYTSGRTWNTSSTPAANSVGKKKGRWPANLMLEHDQGCEQIGVKRGKKSVINRFKDGAKPFGNGAGHEYETIDAGTDDIPIWQCVEECPARMVDEQSGTKDGVARMFFTSKANKRERNLGLDDGEANLHPTVKPIALMRYLVRMVTPPNGIVLDPFMGSGTTMCAVVLEGFSGIGIDLTEEYMPIAEKRIAYWQEQAESGS